MHSRIAAELVGQPRATAGLWRRWTTATTAGELVGFAVPSVVGVLTASITERLPEAGAGALMLAAMVVAGFGEGAVLGLAQALVLRPVLPALSTRRWTGATALAAALAYLLVMAPNTVVDVTSLPPPVVTASGLVAGLLFVLVMGTAQWLVLRPFVPRARGWIAVNAIAWPLGVAIPVAALSLAPDGWPAWAMVFVGIASGLLMGMVVGAITGLELVRVLPRRPTAPDAQNATSPLP